MNDNQMKINWKNILIAVMAGLLIFAVITNANQANEIESLHSRINHLNSELENVRGTVSSIYNNVDEQLKKQASLITNTEHTLGNLNADKHTIDVEIKVSVFLSYQPKKYSLSLASLTVKSSTFSETSF